METTGPGIVSRTVTVATLLSSTRLLPFSPHLGGHEASQNPRGGVRQVHPAPCRSHCYPYRSYWRAAASGLYWSAQFLIFSVSVAVARPVAGSCCCDFLRGSFRLAFASFRSRAESFPFSFSHSSLGCEASFHDVHKALHGDPGIPLPPDPTWGVSKL